ncbi:hypothetical protein RMATCC62417_13806 [Rhizopus microsporus]|nr:hypothetical protein RMATCC62417_13806 [Rhizopus microsporus]
MESGESSDTVSDKSTFTRIVGYAKSATASQYANVEIVVEMQINPQENGASIRRNSLIDQANASIQQASTAHFDNSPLQVPNSNNKPIPPINAHRTL